MNIGITGHQNIPKEALGFVEERLTALLRRYANLCCVSSLAAGADQLFAQTGITCGAALHVVVPCKQYLTTFATEQARQYYQNLLTQAATSELLGFEQPSEEAFLQAGRRVADLSDLLVAVWDGEGAQGKGGTADIVTYARKTGKEVAVIWPAGVKR